jgi:microsomal epoxide hydrolase
MAKEAFTVAVPDETLCDLKERLKRTRFASDFANDGWQYGTNLDYHLKRLVEYWIDGYDWRRAERESELFSQLHGPYRGHPDPLHPRARQGAAPDSNHHEPWMAVDVL